MTFRDDLALQLLADAVQFGPVEGWRLNIHDEYPDAPRSPFYIDLRPSIRSVPSFRRQLGECISDLIGRGELRLDCISDVPQAGTPLVTTVSDLTGIPMISPRLEGKRHGTGREIHGIYEPGLRVAIIDDLRTTGGSMRRAAEVHQRHGLEVVAYLAVIDRSG